MTLTPDVERAIDHCYEAILLPKSWIGALDLLSCSLGGQGCNFVAHGTANDTGTCAHSTGMGRWQELWALNQDWVTDLCWPRCAPKVKTGGRSLLQSDLFSADEVQHSRFHREIAGPAGCLHWASASFLVERDAFCMPVYRPTPFTRADTGQFVEVSYHLERIIRMNRAVINSHDESELVALDRFGRAAMLVDRVGRVLRMNRAAEARMSEDFHVHGGRLMATDLLSQDRIDALIHVIRTTVPGAFLQTPVTVITRDGLPWLTIDTLPFGPRFEDSFSGARAILVISDLTEASARIADDLRTIFGLTSAEARLAAALCRGNSLGEIAREFGVGLVTVRSHLKSIFSKTGTRRQAELVAVLARV